MTSAGVGGKPKRTQCRRMVAQWMVIAMNRKISSYRVIALSVKSSMYVTIMAPRIAKKPKPPKAVVSTSPMAGDARRLIRSVSRNRASAVPAQTAVPSRFAPVLCGSNMIPTAIATAMTTMAAPMAITRSA